MHNSLKQTIIGSLLVILAGIGFWAFIDLLFNPRPDYTIGLFEWVALLAHFLMLQIGLRKVFPKEGSFYQSLEELKKAQAAAYKITPKNPEANEKEVNEVLDRALPPRQLKGHRRL